MKSEICEVDKTGTYPEEMEIYYAIEVPLTPPLAAQNARQDSIQLYDGGTGHRKSTHRSRRVETGLGGKLWVKGWG